jgi:hypothetical protein
MNIIITVKIKYKDRKAIHFKAITTNRAAADFAVIMAIDAAASHFAIVIIAKCIIKAFAKTGAAACLLAGWRLAAAARTIITVDSHYY